MLCPACRAVLYVRRLRRNQRICPDCGHHGRVPATERLDQLLDPGYRRLPDPADVAEDPLGFTDTRPYRQRLAEARDRTGLADAVVAAHGTVAGHPVVVAVTDAAFLGGSLGCAAGEAITRAAETALDARVPLLLVTASTGTRLQEGTLALMQMAKTATALARLDEAGVLTVALVTDPTFGGPAASYVSMCDIIVAEPRARMGFAGPDAAGTTSRVAPPSGFQTAEFLLNRGLVDAVWPRTMLREPLALLLSAGRPLARAPGLAEVATDGTTDGTTDGGADGPAHRDPARIAPPAADAPPPVPPGSAGTRTRPVPANLVPADPLANPADPGSAAPGSAAPGSAIGPDRWARVARARHLGRPTSADYISLLLDDFEELHGDRVGGDCPAVVGGIGTMDGRHLVVLGHQKGHGPAELAIRQFGMASPGGHRKAARLMRLAGKLGVPVLTLIDTPGAHPGVEAEERGQAQAIAANLRLMAGLPVPIVAVVTGEGGGAGALALALADRVLICANAVYAAATPEVCAAALWQDATAAPRAARELRPDPAALLDLGVVDAIVPEPAGGAHTDHASAAALLRAALTPVLAELSGLDSPGLVAARRARFRGYGRPARATGLEAVSR